MRVKNSISQMKVQFFLQTILLEHIFIYLQQINQYNIYLVIFHHTFMVIKVCIKVRNEGKIKK